MSDAAVLDKTPVSVQPPNGGVQASGGSMQKENAPIGTQGTAELIKSSKPELQIDKDLEDLGVEAEKDPQTDESIGISEHIKKFTPDSTLPPEKVEVEMPEAIKGKTSSRIGDSVAALKKLWVKVIKATKVMEKKTV
jgi:hypothetical protein